MKCSKCGVPGTCNEPTEPKTLTLEQTLEGARKAEERISRWPAWKRDLTKKEQKEQYGFIPTEWVEVEAYLRERGEDPDALVEAAGKFIEACHAQGAGGLVASLTTRVRRAMAHEPEVSQALAKDCGFCKAKAHHECRPGCEGVTTGEVTITDPVLAQAAQRMKDGRLKMPSMTCEEVLAQTKRSLSGVRGEMKYAIMADDKTSWPPEGKDES